MNFNTKLAVMKTPLFFEFHVTTVAHKLNVIDLLTVLRVVYCTVGSSKG